MNSYPTGNMWQEVAIAVFTKPAFKFFRDRHEISH
jgi:hypothetical protein